MLGAHKNLPIPKDRAAKLVLLNCIIIATTTAHDAKIKEHNVIAPIVIKPITKSITIYQTSSKNKEHLQYMRKIQF